MKRLIICVLLACVSSASYATCSGSGIKYAAPINIDLSDKLTQATPEWTGTFTTQYSGTFNCTTGNSEFGYTPVLSTDNTYATILGFSNGKYQVRAEITSPPNTRLAAIGSHNASELNTVFTIHFSLVSQKSTAVISGDTINLNDVLFVTDLSGMSLIEILSWPFVQLGKILQWLFNGFNWPYDSRDMFGQPMTIKYAPKVTTCMFDYAGLTVNLPMLGISQLNGASQPGLTPFTLSMSCNNLSVGGTTDRTIVIFLSSNNLLPSDSSVLVDNSEFAAKGIGLRLVKQDLSNEPVTLSPLTTSRGTATELFRVNEGGKLNEKLSIPMAVYYYVYNLGNVSQGKINTSATVNIIYP